ncbi:MAG: hypothetical protein K1X57_15595, partial [Gemmataceae bacterium]|nr:hypothetical protein [Gemmataceae bacterium]
MSRPKLAIPSYRRHSASNNATVRLVDASGHRRDIYLGEYGSDQSVVAYAQALIQWKAGTEGVSATAGRGLSVNQLILAYWRYAEGYYGSASRELVAYRYALRHVRKLFGPTEAAQFGPKSLQLVRERMI